MKPDYAGRLRPTETRFPEQATYGSASKGFASHNQAGLCLPAVLDDPHAP